MICKQKNQHGTSVLKGYYITEQVNFTISDSLLFVLCLRLPLIPTFDLWATCPMAIFHSPGPWRSLSNCNKVTQFELNKRRDERREKSEKCTYLSFLSRDLALN